MRIAVGAMLCEGNSLTPVLTRSSDFDYAEGEAMLSKVAVTELLRERGCEVIPTVYAHALPGGPVAKADFLRLEEALLSRLPPAGLDGVWLYLHGAMCVEQLGSAEEHLLRAVRRKIGDGVPISVAMDLHADNSDAVPLLCNCITGYRTATARKRSAGPCACCSPASKRGYYHAPSLPVRTSSSAVTRCRRILNR